MVIVLEAVSLWDLDTYEWESFTGLIGSESHHSRGAQEDKFTTPLNLQQFARFLRSSGCSESYMGSLEKAPVGWLDCRATQEYSANTDLVA